MTRRIGAAVLISLSLPVAGSAQHVEPPEAEAKPVEIAFTLPRGYVDGEGKVQRSGVLRLATEADREAVRKDPRALANPVYQDVLLLSRQVMRLGSSTEVGPEVVEGLFASDFHYLERLVQHFERTGREEVSMTCSACGASFTAPLTPAPRTDGASPVPFTLPQGLTDSEGKVHREGEMRLATVCDEVESAASERAQANPRYRELVILSRLITRLGGLDAVDADTLGTLVFSDFSHLRRIYRQHNEPASTAAVTCPHCGAVHEVEAADPP